jgi:hypothetical protein
MLIRSLISVVFSALAVVGALQLALAQDVDQAGRSENVIRCSSGKPNVAAAILACSRIISDRHSDDPIQFAALRNRGAFYSQQDLYAANRPFFAGLTGDRRPRLNFSGSWVGPNLQMDDEGTLAQAFLADGTLSPAPGGAHLKDKAVPITFTEISWWWRGSCAKT